MTIPQFQPISHGSSSDTTTSDSSTTFSGTDTQSPDVVSGVDPTGGIFDNVLDSFMDVTYHVALSMVNTVALSNGTSDIQSGDLAYFCSSGSTMPTGIQPAGTTTTGADGVEETVITPKQSLPLYVIRSLRMQTVVSYNAENPDLANMVELKMTVHEPRGVSFDREMRRVAKLQGYQGHPSRIVWRIDFWFSGYDPSTGAWSEKIDIYNKLTKKKSNVVSYYCNMTALEADVTALGTEYSMSFIPSNMVPARKEVLELETQTISAGTFGDYLSELNKELSKLSQIRTASSETKIIRNYEVTLGDSAKELQSEPMSYPDSSRTNQNQNTSASSPVSIAIGRSETVISMIRKGLDSLKPVMESFIQKDDPDRLKARYHYVVRMETDYSKATFNKDINDYDGVTYRYIVEKFEDWRADPPSAVDTYNENNRSQRERAMIQSGALRRVYNYAYTSENTEVIEYRTRLRLFFYQMIPVVHDNREYHGIQQTTPEPTQQSERDKQAGPSRVDDAQTQAIMNRLNQSGTGRIPHSSGTGGDVTYFRFHDSPQPQNSSQSTGDGSELRNSYRAEWEQAMNNDLALLEGMVVRGDPTFLFSRYAHDGEDLSSNVVPCIIRVNMFTATQDSAWDPDQIQVDQRDLFLGGYYQLYSIDHVFEEGNFTQEFKGFRLKVI